MFEMITAEDETPALADAASSGQLQRTVSFPRFSEGVVSPSSSYQRIRKRVSRTLSLDYLARDQDRYTSDFAPFVALPRVRHCTAQVHLKGEDKLVCAEFEVPTISGVALPVHVFAVFDGHANKVASTTCAEHLLEDLRQRFPSGDFPPELYHDDFQAHLAKIREAVCETFVRLDSIVADKTQCTGCTATLVVLTGWIATVANLGDSEAIIVTHRDHKVVTQTHNLSHCEMEVERVTAAGHVIGQIHPRHGGAAEGYEDGIGPIRMWPGGLCVARSIGDTHIGPAVLAMPHIKQLRIPRSGARLLLASDGLWDSLSFSSAAKLLRRSALPISSADLVKHVQMTTGVHDDTSVVVADVLPSTMEDFGQTVQRSSSMRHLLSRLVKHPSARGAPTGPCPAEGVPSNATSGSLERSGSGKVTMLANIDMALRKPAA